MLLLCLLYYSVSGQIKKNLIYDKWVLSRITYKDGSLLPDENPLKYTYAKYIFSQPDILQHSSIYSERGANYLFEINGNSLVLKSEAGWAMNTLMIEELTEDKLILTQPGLKGYNDPQSLRYEYKRESVYQNSISLTTSDIFSVYHSDTTYKQSPKVYADFNGISFQNFLTSNIREGMMDGIAGHMVASFIVSKNGVADSLKILEGISAGYDKAFIKAFNKGKRMWNAAKLNGKKVNVHMIQEIRYLTGAAALPAYLDSQNANAAFNTQNYDVAIYYLDMALKNVPTDKDNLYKRGICRLKLGNLTGACEDWQTIKKLGGSTADELLAKYCK
jgi:hypothetical protein